MAGVEQDKGGISRLSPGPDEHPPGAFRPRQGNAGGGWQGPLSQRLRGLEWFDRLSRRLAQSDEVEVGGAWATAGLWVAGELAREVSAPLLVVTPEEEAAESAAEDLHTLTGASPLRFPAWEELPAGDEPVDPALFAARLRCLNALLETPSEEDRALVTSVVALVQPVVEMASLRRESLELVVGGELPRDRLIDWLAEREFERIPAVEQPSEFSVRGGIVDVFPHGSDRPYRIEYLGEQVDSIRQFDVATQRSDEELPSATILGITRKALVEAETSGAATSLLAYLSDNFLLAFLEPVESQQRAQGYLEMEGRPSGFHSFERIWRDSRRFRRVLLYRFQPASKGAVDLSVRPLPFEGRDAGRLVGELLGLAGQLEKVVVICTNEAEAHRLSELLSQQEPAWREPGTLHICEGRLSQGFIWPDLSLALVPHHQLFSRYVQRRAPRPPAAAPVEDLLDLEPGDIVVHVSHGIARFRGMQVLERDGREEEFLVLEFANRVRLYVPASRIDLVQKYIGGFRGQPQLSRLGTTAWDRRKEDVARAVGELAAEMLEMQAARATEPGIDFPPDDDLQAQFEAEFPYEETEDQLAVLAEIKRDMLTPRPMDRLICGDVGYGKTELAIRAAFKAALGGKQTAVLVPTTVLAQQHHRTFGERLADYPVRVAELSRFRSRGEQRRILEGLASGAIDIVIGTHRLLQKDVQFKDLGLVIIDEEQRFGVVHKEHLKRLRRTVDVLTLTATPIPRTLHMSLLGLREVSVLNTPPQDRLAIRTAVIPFDRKRIREAVLHELARGGQTFFVHNRVWNIEEVADELRRLVPEAHMAVAHGQMPEHLLEQRMADFLDRKIDVLVATTIIESGLDIPNANTIIINEADSFGLADLHQLRGRVGRYKHRAYAYFLLPRQRVLAGPARRRLKAIEDYAQLGAGFRIALRDLEIRGAGNILGPEQSGHIAAVGYELYRQLLEQAIRRDRGEPEPRAVDAYVDLRLPAYFPPGYIPTEGEKMALYRRLCQSRIGGDLEDIGRELRDRFGPLPREAELLLYRQALRIRAGEVGITSMVRTEDRVIVHFEEVGVATCALERAGGIVRLLDPHTIHLYPFPGDLGPEETVAFFRKVLQVEPVALK